MFLNNQPEQLCKRDNILAPSVKHIYSMECNNAPAEKIPYITSCIECIDTLNNLHRIFEFGDDIMCLNWIDTCMKYKFGLNYVHEIPNDLT